MMCSCGLLQPLSGFLLDSSGLVHARAWIVPERLSGVRDRAEGPTIRT